jgi:CheY-like chemotaxis protein
MQALSASAQETQSGLREPTVSLRIVEEAQQPQAPIVEPAAALQPPAATPRETKPVETKPIFMPDVEQALKHVSSAPTERRSAPVERKPEAPEVKKAAPPTEAPVVEKPRPEKFVSHVVREKRVDDSLEPVVAPPPVRKGNRQTNGAEVVRAAEAAARERERRARGTIMPRRLLLTVSDAARMAQLNSLIRSAGYEARAAFGGQQALDLLRIERPDLLVLDFELQGIDGLETLRRLRKQNGGRLTLPVVLLLPEKFETVRQEAMALGTRGIVSMPYDPVDLLDTVRVAGTVD